MATRYRCTSCKGTFDQDLGPPPACPENKGQLEVYGQGLLVGPPTGCHLSLQAFSRQSFTRRHYVPSTGRGKFDCTYNPAQGELQITVRFSVEFQNQGYLDFYGPLERGRLKEDFRASVPRYWDNRCTLRCTKPGWTTVVVRPVFRVEFDSQVGAHFRMVLSRESELAKTSPSGRECRGFVSVDQVTSGDVTVQDRVELRDFQVRDFNHAVGGFLTAGNDREMYEKAMTDARLDVANSGPSRAPVATLPFRSASADPNDVRALVNAYAVELKKALPGSHPVPILVKGFFTLPEIASLASERAAAVRDLLRGAQINNPVNVEPANGAGKSAVEIRLDRDYEARFTTGQSEFAYNVSAHEFGHMIGLADEYEAAMLGIGSTAANNPKGVVRANYQALCHRAGVTSPVFPSHTSSMMSDGMTLLNWHYVTVWEALATLTRDYTQEAHWVIHMN